MTQTQVLASTFSFIIYSVTQAADTTGIYYNTGYGVCICRHYISLGQVLRAAFKRSKFDHTSREQLQMLDPFLPLLTSSLSSRHTKVLTHCLHCLLPLLRLPLPSLGASVHRVVAGLFGVLRKYARAGEVIGANRELVIAAFKVELLY